jgi:hypothetical protein
VVTTELLRILPGKNKMTKSVTVRLQMPEGVAPYTLSQEFATYMNETYIDTKRVTVEVSIDEATKYVVSTMKFATDADKAAYFADPMVVASITERRTYNTANGIVLVDTTTA